MAVKIGPENYFGIYLFLYASYKNTPDDENLMNLTYSKSIEFPSTVQEALTLNDFICGLTIKEFGEFVEDINSSECLNWEENRPIDKWIQRNPICKIFDRPEVMDLLWEGWGGMPI